jgi:hypothetical protein
MLASHELGVLKSLFPEKSPQTLKDLQKKCQYSYERIHSAVKSLDERGAINLKRYGNVIVATPNYGSDLAFLAYLHYMVSLKTRMFEEHRATSQKIQKIPAWQKKQPFAYAADEINSCLYDISEIDSELVAVTEVSRTPKNKVSFFYTQKRSLEPVKIENLLLSMRYKYPNIKIEPRAETKDTLERKKNDPACLGSVVIKGLENFYRIFYL